MTNEKTTTGDGTTFIRITNGELWEFLEDIEIVREGRQEYKKGKTVLINDL